MEVASSLAAFVVGGVLGLIGRKLSIHFRGYRLPARAIERLRCVRFEGHDGSHWDRNGVRL